MMINIFTETGRRFSPLQVFAGSKTIPFGIFLLVLAAIPLMGESGSDSEFSSTPPAADSSFYNDGKTLYATSRTKFSLSSTDDMAEQGLVVEYRVDNSDFIIYNEPIVIEQEGRHVLVYRSMDQVGNREQSKTFELVIDNTPPDVYISGDTAFFEKDGVKYQAPDAVFKLDAIDALSGVKSIFYAIGDGAEQQYNDSIAFNQGGTYSLKYSAVDNLGNKSTPSQFTFVVDGEKPSLSIRSSLAFKEANGKKYTSSENSFTVEAQDGQSGIKEIQLRSSSDAPFRRYTTPVSFTESGEVVLEAKAIDNVGNESEIVSLSFYVDKNPPETRLIPVGN